jgi:hypothetical protein
MVSSYSIVKEKYGDYKRSYSRQKVLKAGLGLTRDVMEHGIRKGGKLFHLLKFISKRIFFDTYSDETDFSHNLGWTFEFPFLFYTCLALTGHNKLHTIATIMFIQI